jgi:cytochrome b
MVRDQTVSTSVVRVWDIGVRLAHWLLAVGFVVAYVTEGDKEVQQVHVWAGYGITLIVLWRLVWGLVGPEHARFVNFVRGPRTIWLYLRGLVSGGGRRYLGHNPAGGAMVILLLASLLGTTLSGLGLYAVDKGKGPLAGWLAEPNATTVQSPAAGTKITKPAKGRAGKNVDLEDKLEKVLEEMHEFLANFSLFLVLLHVAGVAASSFAHRENLPRSMITGNKPG